ncbi:cation channel family protein (macronuclear) [Tetrahymena thermophila SB210]|uniref:Cation channel family protein n=1 Tax=Tetrahymena thermophila (strain SB210) TaxID=312017 RepID=W7XB07_TETTS|nr:cation channel family protein [Tetrahymena thermophila SB210]EWS73608.1 cation channel family protein [Tetrahymena thermophila SB210]|eukprot:XP_012653838.1 cation channel family protein [Tetrahymena thermophila SB210]
MIFLFSILFIKLLRNINLFQNFQQIYFIINLKFNERFQRNQSKVLTLVSKQRRKHNIELEGEQSKLSWQKKWLIIMYYISKFKTVASLTKKLFRHELLTAQQLKLIGDQTVNIEKLKQIECYNFQRMMSYTKFNKIIQYKTYKWLKIKIKKYFSNFPFLLLSISTIYNKLADYVFSSLPLFNYLSNFYVVWQAIIFISSFINFIYLPFEFSFNIQRGFFFQNYISLICPIIYSCDIFIKANTVSFQQGSNLSMHKEIFKQYLAGQFISDLISLLSLNISFAQIKAFYFLFFLRFSNSFMILDIFREKFFSRTYISGIISLVLLFMSSLFFAHLFACLWYYIGTQSSQGWIEFYQLDTTDIYSNYICSYYFAIVTMTTIGYGDITAKTTEERLVMIFFTLTSCGIFGYIINSIGNILADIKQKSDQYLTELAKLNQYFKKYQVCLQIQANVRRYLQFKYKEGIQDQISAVQSLNSLSQHLQNQIKMDVVSRELKQIDFLKQICKEETFYQLSLEVQEKIYQPEQIILDQNDIKEPSIYIINYGKVLKNSQYDLSSKINEIIELKEKERFGVIEFFMNLETSKFNYKSMELTSIYSLNLSSFLKVIQKDNEIYEKFCFLRDQIVFQKSLYLVKHSCESCKSLSHNLKECPCIFYKSRKLAIIKRYKDNKFKNQQEINRKQIRTQNCLFFKKYYESESQSSNEDQNFFSSQKILFSSVNNNTPNNDNQSFKPSQFFENQQTEQNEIDKIIFDIKSPLIIQKKKLENEKQMNDDLKNIKSFQKLEIIEEEESKNSIQILGLQQQNFVKNNHMSITSILENNSKNDQICVLQAIYKNIKEIFKILQDENGFSQFQKKVVSQQQTNSSHYIKLENQLPSQKQLKMPQLHDASLVNAARINFQNQLQNKQHKIISEHCCEELEKMQKFKIFYPKFNYDIVIEKFNSITQLQNIPLNLRRLKQQKKQINENKRMRTLK